MTMQPSRRLFLTLAAGVAVGSLGAPTAFAGRGASTDRRLVVFLLRGGLDGLAALPAHGDPAYRRARGGLALSPPSEPGGVVDLDGTFGLHPALESWEPLYKARELLPIHAVATAYRARSHFDGQDVLESGAASAQTRRDGWLNRALVSGGLGTRADAALALSQVVPLILRGEAQVGSATLDARASPPPELLGRLATLYADDDLFGPALARGLGSRRAVLTALEGGAEAGPRRGAARAGKVLGRLLAASDAPSVAAVEFGGWDTHAGQGTGQGALARRLRDLASGLLALRSGLGDVWSRTVVLVVTEFGRTVVPNGTGGTDHGTGAAAFLAGGAVAGGRVLADWPGVEPGALHEGRDLRPTLDLRSVCKGVLRDHLGVPSAALERVVFPDSRVASPTSGLVRS